MGVDGIFWDDVLIFAEYFLYFFFYSFENLNFFYLYVFSFENFLYLFFFGDDVNFT
jgi:hypothetical protein